MAKSVDVSCPYSRSLSTGKEIPVVIRENYELQYNEHHIVEKVKVGETDVVKEVESHIGEAGLMNAIKNALAHGEDPSVVYGKVEPGVSGSVPNNIVLDDLLELSQQNKAKFEEIAKSIGCSLEELQSAIKSGTLEDLVLKSKDDSVESDVKEGE